MSDHFNITLERKLESNSDEAGVGVSNVRRIELITGTGRRRLWCDDDKARIVVESLAPGANVSEVARRNGLSPQQLFAWRREARALFGEDRDAMETSAALRAPRRACRARRAEIDDDAPAFVPAVIAGAAPSSLALSSQSASNISGTIEIMVGAAVVRVTGQVENATLVAVLRAVRMAS